MMGRPNHVLFVGIDGVRWDVLKRTSTPGVDRVTKRGFLAPLQVNAAAPTISGPSWATMVTGVLAPDHNIYDNDLSAHRLVDHPDFIARVVAAHPGVQTYVAADWEPLVTTSSGGPMLRGGGLVPDRDRGPTASTADWERADQQVADGAAAAIRGYDSARGSVTFVYLRAVDTAGHRSGVDERYVEMLIASDRRLGEVLDAVEERPLGPAENWLVIVATDHGHVDGGGHGGDDPHERTAWIAACGTRVPTQSPGVLEQADVAGHVLEVLGLVPENPEFVGLPFGRRRAPAVAGRDKSISTRTSASG